MKLINLIPIYKDVLKWNAFAGNSIYDENVKNTYIDLVKEENSEIFESIEEEDKIEYIDGLADSLVVGYYLYAISKGLENVSDEYEERFELLNSLNSEVDKIRNINEKDLVLEKIDDILKSLEKIAFSVKNDVNIVGACEEVMRSNWTKFPKVEDVNPDDEIKYIESKGKYKGVTYKVRNDGKFDRYVFLSNKGKVVKPSPFEEPNLKQFISESFNPYY